MSPNAYLYPVSRKKRQRFSSRIKYLRAKTERERGGQFCQVMEAAARSADGTGSHSEDEWHQFPWLTLVLGSGALEVPEESRYSAEILARAVARHFEGVEWEGESEVQSVFVEEYTMSLLRDRLRPQSGLREKSGPSSLDEPEVDAVTANLVLLAALLTRFFHCVRSAKPHAESRWDDDIAVFDPNVRDEKTQALPGTVLAPARSAIGVVLDGLDDLAPAIGERVTDAVRALLVNVRGGLVAMTPTAEISLRVKHLQLLTELAWHFLVKELRIYPGWTDLLLSLMLDEGEQAMEGARRPRPRYQDFNDLPEVVVQLLEPVTSVSWKLRDPDEKRTDLRNSVAGATAEVLWSQADSTGSGATARQLPPAVAFVMSFDIEVEMALWTAPSSRGGKPFLVVLPVHLLEDSGADEAQLCWLAGEVKPSWPDAWTEESENYDWMEGLKALREPQEWRLITPQSHPEMLSGRPVVVHLSGSPLFKLPKLEDAKLLVKDLNQLGLATDPSAARLVHAVVVDEYLAMRQSEAELFWSSNHQADPEARKSRALPPALTGDGPDNRRFWMAMGIPIADPAVRLRVMSQITVRWIQTGKDQALRRANSLLRPPPGRVDREPDAGIEELSQIQRADVEGVAVNLRIDDDEATLLYWLGLDVLETDCNEFVSDLRRYVRHVRCGTPEKRPKANQACPLCTTDGLP